MFALGTKWTCTGPVLDLRLCPSLSPSPSPAGLVSSRLVVSGCERERLPMSKLCCALHWICPRPPPVKRTHARTPGNGSGLSCNLPDYLAASGRGGCGMQLGAHGRPVTEIQFDGWLYVSRHVARRGRGHGRQQSPWAQLHAMPLNVGTPTACCLSLIADGPRPQQCSTME